MKKYSHKSESAILRQKAEEQLKNKPLQDDVQLSVTEVRRLTYELKMHQIELELQNEDLKSSRSLAQETAEKYTELYDFAPSGYFTLSNAGEIIDVNLCGSQMLGVERSRLKNKHFNVFLSRETKLVFSRFLEKVFSSKVKETCEVTLLTKDNLLLFVYLTGIAMDKGEQCLVNMVDITNLIHAEEALQASENRFRSIFENTSTAIAIIEADTTISMVNEAYCQSSGYTKQEIIGLSWTQLIVSEDLERLKEYNRQRLINPKDAPDQYEFRFIHKNGETRHALMSVAMVQHEGKIITSFTDITDRKRAEEALTNSEIRFRRLFESTKDGILILDAESGMILDVNPFLIELLGYSREQFIEKAIWGIGIFKDISANKEKFLELQQEEYVRYENLPLETSTGRKIYVEFISIVYFAASHKVIQCNIRDITDSHLAKKELIIAKEHAEESDRLKSAFLANMSHEIRTPMNGILGFAELLKESKLSGEEQEKYIGIIKKSGIRLLSIINDIVDISKIEAGQMGTTLSEVNVNEKIEYIHSFFLPQARQKGIYFSYKCSLPSDQARITSDKEKIFAILTNLVNNACKFTQVGSIEFGYERKGPFLEFFVKDTGIGINEANKDVIFERFRQGGKISSKTFEGSGLGLSISKAYVEMLGGKIWVESEEDQGSVFYFTIPYLTEEQVQSNNPNILPAEKESGQIKNLKILITENDMDSDFLITSILNKNSHEILHATTGIETIEVCRNNPDLDLVLMDIRMPDMSGLEATQQIRQFNKNFIIIAQTAYALVGDREAAISAGCNDYISKPINKGELQALIQKYFKV